MPSAQLMTPLSQTHTTKLSLAETQQREKDKHNSAILLMQLMIGFHDCANKVYWNRLYYSLLLHRYHIMWKLLVHKTPWHDELKGNEKNYTLWNVTTLNFRD
jgi:hypothetical protein